MRHTITLTTTHLFLIALFIGVTLLVSYAGNALSQGGTPVGTVWHPLSQIAKTSSDLTPVDTSGSTGPGTGPANSIIDLAEEAARADSASSVPCAGVTGTSGSPCVNSLIATTKIAALLQDNTLDCLEQSRLDWESCTGLCTNPRTIDACLDDCDDARDIRDAACNRGESNVYNTCDTQCTGELCISAWETGSGNAVSCSSSFLARTCRCVKRQ